MDLRFERGFLLADGDRMLVGFGSRDKDVYLMSNYVPTSLSFYQPWQDMVPFGGPARRVPAGPLEVTIEIKAHGPVQSIPAKEGMKLFRNAESLSVNELLAIAYQKMSGRQS